MKQFLVFIVSVVLTSCSSSPEGLFPQSKAPNAAVLKSDGSWRNSFAQVLLINRLVCSVTEVNGVPVSRNGYGLSSIKLSPGNYNVRIVGDFTMGYQTIKGSALLDLKVEASHTYRFGGRHTQQGTNEARFFIEDITEGQRKLIAEQVVPFF